MRTNGCQMCKEEGITKKEKKDYCPCHCKFCGASKCSKKCEWYVTRR